SAHEGHEQDRAQAANPNGVPTLVLYKRTRLTRKSTQVPPWLSTSDLLLDLQSSIQCLFLATYPPSRI
ncbi:hypothetical protein XENOCAPTIV_021799, partial [Xenoophorus captivus]